MHDDIIIYQMFHSYSEVLYGEIDSGICPGLLQIFNATQVISLLSQNYIQRWDMVRSQKCWRLLKTEADILFHFSAKTHMQLVLALPTSTQQHLVPISYSNFPFLFFELPYTVHEICSKHKRYFNFFSFIYPVLKPQLHAGTC